MKLRRFQWGGDRPLTKKTERRTNLFLKIHGRKTPVESKPKSRNNITINTLEPG